MTRAYQIEQGRNAAERSAHPIPLDLHIFVRHSLSRSCSPLLWLSVYDAKEDAFRVSQCSISSFGNIQIDGFVQACQLWKDAILKEAKHV